MLIGILKLRGIYAKMSRENKRFFKFISKANNTFNIVIDPNNTILVDLSSEQLYISINAYRDF